jgi:hypothetical protein
VYLTGNGLSARVARYLITILDEGWMIEALNGALETLGIEANWTKRGDVEPFDAAERMNDMLVSFRRDDMLLGAIVIFSGSVELGSFLPCDGGTYSRDDYPDLYERLNDVFIIDAFTFTTPNLPDPATGLKYFMVAIE